MTPTAPGPLLTVLVLAPSSSQAEGAPLERTLASLDPSRQRNVDAATCEIVVVGNEPGGDTRLAAARAALARTHAALVAFVEDLPLFTPRVIEQLLAAAGLSEHPLVAIPGYVVEANALERQPENPYGLLENAPFDPLNPHGYLAGIVESTSFACRRDDIDRALAATSGPPPQSPRSLFGKLLRLPDVKLLVLGGEGALYPSSAERVKRTFWTPERHPTVLGPIPGPMHDALARSLDSETLHAAIIAEAGRTEWPLDVPRPTVRASREPPSPKLSIVLVTYCLSRQLENTLYSLSAAHQWNVSEDDYEIVVVENRSSAVFGEERARSFGANVRYFLRDDPGVSPAPSMNFGVRQARGKLLGLMIDAARMVTPRVVEHALLARRLHPRPLVAVPGYHLGPGRQHLTSLEGYDEAEETRLLSATGWKTSGYRLFEIGCLDEATQGGFLSPMLEGTCLFCPRACFDEIDGFDERFDLEGGGEVNHDLFARLSRLPDTRYVVLWGEGNFHQYHGGVSTRSAADREAKLERFRQQHDRIRGHRYATVEREPWLLGTYSGVAQAVLHESVGLGKLRHAMAFKQGRAEWEND